MNSSYSGFFLDAEEEEDGVAPRDFLEVAPPFAVLTRTEADPPERLRLMPLAAAALTMGRLFVGGMVAVL